MKINNFFFLLLSVVLVTGCSKNYNDKIVLDDGEVLYKLSKGIESGKIFEVIGERALDIELDYFGEKITSAFNACYTGKLEKSGSSFLLTLDSAVVLFDENQKESESSDGDFDLGSSLKTETNINLLLEKGLKKLGNISFSVGVDKQIVFADASKFESVFPEGEESEAFLDMLTEDSLRSILEPLFLWVPDTLPIIGESWTMMSNQAAPAKGELFQKYTLQKVSGKKYLVNLVSEGVSKYSIDSFNFAGSLNGTGKLNISRKDSFSGTYEIEDHYRLKVAVPVNLFNYEESDLESLCKIKEVKKIVVKEVVDVE
jgi:hypothetical protein